jgi:hypothetical protein
MASIRISMTNEDAMFVAQLLRSTLEGSFGMPKEDWLRVDAVTRRLEDKIDWSMPDERIRVERKGQSPL